MHQGYLRGDIGTGIEPGRGVGAGDLVIVGAARYVAIVNPWSRVATSFTGRLSRRAATAIRAVRWVSEPRAPKAPPINGETTRILSASMPSCSARPFLTPVTFWLPSHTVSLS